MALGESTIVRTWFAPFFSTELHQILRVPLSHIWRKLTSGALHTGLFAAGLLGANRRSFVRERTQWFLSLYFAINLATIVVTPWQDQFWRYLAPSAPLTLIFFFLALFAIRRWLRSPALQMGIYGWRDYRSDCHQLLYCWFKSPLALTFSNPWDQ